MSEQYQPQHFREIRKPRHRKKIAVGVVIAAVVAVAVVAHPTQKKHVVPKVATTTVQAPIKCVVINGGPDPKCTPGAINPDVTQATIRSTICKRGWTATIRPPVSYTNVLKLDQLKSESYTVVFQDQTYSGVGYAFPDKDATHYEEDHLISLELGGSPVDPKNLWPEPGGSAGVPLIVGGANANSRIKDTFENALNNRVCSGKVTLADAQRQIANDWYANDLASRSIKSGS